MSGAHDHPVPTLQRRVQEDGGGDEAGPEGQGDGAHPAEGGTGEVQTGG